MEKYLALLRGINVSGKNKIKMEKLKSVLSMNRFTEVETYIQSGNIVFGYSKSAINEIEKEIRTCIKKHFNLDVPVIVKTTDQLKWIINNNPFLSSSNFDKTKMYVTFLANIPNENLAKELSTITYETEQYKLNRDIIYLYFDNGYGTSKMNNNFIENKLKIIATTRNWNTVLKLTDMMNANS